MAAIDDRQAIEGVIREFLAGAAHGKFSARLWTGSMAESLALGEDVAENSPLQLPFRQGSARIRKLAIRSIEGDSAFVDLKAECLSKVDYPLTGERHLTQRYDGPILLRRESDSWRIVTLKQDGVDVASALFDPVRAERAVEGVRVEATARFRKTDVYLGVLVRNLGDSPAVLERVSHRGRVWWFFEDGGLLRRRPLVLRSGARWGFAQALKASPLRRSLALRVRMEGQDVTLALQPPRRSLSRRLRHSMHPNTVLHLLALIALLAIPLSSPVSGFALVLLAVGTFNALGEVISFAAGGRFSAQALYGGLGLAEVAVAAFLLRREHVDLVAIVVTLVLLAPQTWFQYRALSLRRQAELAEVVRGEAPQLPNA